MNTLTTPVPDIKLTTVEESAWVEGTESRLNTKFRCDQRDCGSQAYVEATTKSGILIFCAHHGKVQRQLMEDKGVLLKWYSEMGRLVENRKQGSEN